MRVAVPNESGRGERRVALVPDVVQRLARKDHTVAVEPGAGEGAHISDAAFEEAGAGVARDALAQADLIALVGAPTVEEVGRLPEGSTVVGFLAPLTKPDLAQALAQRNITSFAMESVPRTTRAQSMDALSSQATVAGYRAALLAAENLPRFLPMLTTAAGTVRPAKVMVLGAGVAGLQAIATAKRLGAVVSAFDVRKAVKEQIESLGASFVELELDFDAEAEGGYARQLTDEEQQAQREALADAMADMDAVITTALVPGKPAPLLVTADAVRKMKAGSVIVDLAGESGGNCELSEAGQTVVKEDVTILAPLNLPAEMADHASSLYARNVLSFVELVSGDDGALAIDWEDEIVKGACLTRDGKLAKEASA